MASFTSFFQGLASSTTTNASSQQQQQQGSQQAYQLGSSTAIFDPSQMWQTQPGTVIPVPQGVPLTTYTTTYDEFSPEDREILHMLLAKIKARNNPPPRHPADTLEEAVNKAIEELRV